MPFHMFALFFKGSLPLPTVIVHKPAEDRTKFAGLSTFDLATGTSWRDFFKVIVCFKMIVIKCVAFWAGSFQFVFILYLLYTKVFQLCCQERLSVLFCCVPQCIYSLCCCISDVCSQC